MEKTLLIIIAAQGLCTVLSHHYQFIYDRKNMSEAQRYCREKHIDLASVENMEDVAILNQMADLSQMTYGNYNAMAWIGLYEAVNSWRWSLSNMSFYQDGEMDFRKWHPGQPNNELRRQTCTLLWSSGSWNDVPCTISLPAICVDLRGPDVTFVRTENLPWSDAQSYCRSHHTDLASVRNEAENQKIMEVVGPNAWIGLFKDSWKWTDGSNSRFTYWDSNKPDSSTHPPKHCVMANFGNAGRWHDWPCDFEAPFICSTKPITVNKQVIRLQLKTSSSLDLNDPAVMEQILNQLKQRMKDQNADVKLSWKKQPDGQCFQKKNKKDKKTGGSGCDGHY